MTVYLVILEDRHMDVQVQVFASKNDAMDRAKEIVKGFRRHDYEPEEPDEEVEGWLFNATLSDEGDAVRVEEAELR